MKTSILTNFLILVMTLTAFGQIERNPKGAYFKMGKDDETK